MVNYVTIMDDGVKIYNRMSNAGSQPDLEAHSSTTSSDIKHSTLLIFLLSNIFQSNKLSSKKQSTGL